MRHVIAQKVSHLLVSSVLIFLAGEDDDDLYESLARARKAAEKQQKGAADPFAEQLASRREQEEAQQAMAPEPTAGQQLPVTVVACLQSMSYACIVQKKKRYEKEKETLHY